MINFIRIRLVAIILSVVFSAGISAQSMAFNVSTQTYNGQFSPYNCFVVWITNAKGTYVKTINRQSSIYTYYLSHWRINSGAKMTDGLTGATLTNHNEPYFDEGVLRIPFVWNCRDYNGVLVPDGDYFVNVEFTENDATGKYMKYAFTKGSENQSVNYPDVSTDPGVYFRNAVLKYFASTSDIPILDVEKDIKISFDMANKNLLVNIDILQFRNAELFILNTKGVLLLQKKLYYSPCVFSISDLPGGVYIANVISANHNSYSQKIRLK